MSNITSQTLLVVNNVNRISCSVRLNDSTDVTVVVSKAWLCIWTHSGLSEISVSILLFLLIKFPVVFVWVCSA